MKSKILSFSLAIGMSFISACNSTTDNSPPSNEQTAFNETTETEAIMKVIEGETECFFKGDYECWAKHWSHEDYVFQGWNNDDGTAAGSVGWNKIDSQGKNWIEKYYQNGENIIHPVVKREKPLVKFFNDKTAYLIWKQYNADKEKTVFRTSHETRIMEKKEDGWKIVNVTALWDTQPKIPFDSLKLNEN
jgi:hypothetical protein